MLNKYPTSCLKNNLKLYLLKSLEKDINLLHNFSVHFNHIPSNKLGKHLAIVVSKTNVASALTKHMV